MIKGDFLHLDRRLRFTAHALKQHSLGQTFISDRHCTNIQVCLEFTLGVTDPTQIIVTSVVTSGSPMTIDALVAKALDQRGDVCITKSTPDRLFITDSKTYKGTVPRQMINELKRQLFQWVTFRFSDSSFVLRNAVAPANENGTALAFTEGEE